MVGFLVDLLPPPGGVETSDESEVEPFIDSYEQFWARVTFMSKSVLQMKYNIKNLKTNDEITKLT